MTTDEPIPVSLALRAVERAIRECDAATPGPWEMCSKVVTYTWDGSDHVVTRKNEDASLAVLARAGFRGTLEYLRADLEDIRPEFDLLSWEVAAVAPLIAHYDRVSPTWRTE